MHFQTRVHKIEIEHRSARVGSPYVTNKTKVRARKDMPKAGRARGGTGVQKVGIGEEGTILWKRFTLGYP
jgi:hypothetical protein